MDILAKYPQLEAEDVHQALGYQLNNTDELHRILLLDGKGPLGIINGYLAMLKHILSEDFDCKSEETSNLTEDVEILEKQVANLWSLFEFALPIVDADND